jgi:hypothetical protein
MKTMKAKAAEKFENIVHDTLKEAGLLFPVSDKEIERFESRFTNLPLPEKLKNPEDILNRNRDKISVRQQPTFQAAALFDSSETQPIPSSSRAVRSRTNVNAAKRKKRVKKKK